MVSKRFCAWQRALRIARILARLGVEGKIHVREREREGERERERAASNSELKEAKHGGKKVAWTGQGNGGEIFRVPTCSFWGSSFSVLLGGLVGFPLLAEVYY